MKLESGAKVTTRAETDAEGLQGIQVEVRLDPAFQTWTDLEDRMHVARGGLLWVYVCWQAANSFSQLLFAWWSDRAPKRWLIWVGPLLSTK